MKKLLLIALLVVGCEEVLDPDTTAPTLVITFPVNSSTLTETTTVTVDVADDGEIGIVKLLVDGIETYVDTTAPYQFVWDVCVQSTGTHTLMAKTEDGAGNQGQSDLLTFTIDANYDCTDVCGGDSLEDNCEVCDNNSTNDCDMDECGEWGGDNSTCTDNCGIINGNNDPNTGICDCEGTPNGDKLLDNCGVCDTDSTNDCVQDECGNWGGDGVMLWGNCYSIANTTGIDLNNVGLTGETPSNIGALVNLTYIDLGRNDLTTIPTSIENLTNLWWLNYYNNNLTSIPSTIDNLTSLTHLDLAGNDLISIPTSICNIYNNPGHIQTVLDNNNLCEEFHYDCITRWEGQDQSNCDCAGITGGDAVIDCSGTCGGTEIDDDNDGICDSYWGTVNDIDGNTYNTIKIGTQTWMVENLKVTTYRDGTPIVEENSTINWKNPTGGYYRNIDGETYGHMYNWYAVDDDTDGNDDNYLCMDGWEVPSIDAFNTLISYVGGDGEKLRSTGSIEVGNGLWVGENVGATNASGFSAIPAGYIDDGPGDIEYRGTMAMFWSSTKGTSSGCVQDCTGDLDRASYFRITDTNTQTSINTFKTGASIRCIKD